MCCAKYDSKRQMIVSLFHGYGSRGEGDPCWAGAEMICFCIQVDVGKSVAVKKAHCCAENEYCSLLQMNSTARSRFLLFIFTLTCSDIKAAQYLL